MVEVDINKVSDIIRKVVKTVIMPHYLHLQSGEIKEKSPGDYVTVADEESEKALSAKLIALLPNSLVIGEESVAKDKNVLNKINEDKPVWIIDPIDGTRHFIKGDRRWGVLLALAVNGETQYGWIYDAIEDRMITTKNGAGVFVEGKKLERRLNDSKNLSDIVIGCHHPILKIKELKGGLSKFNSVEENFCSVEHLSDFILGKSVDVLAGYGNVNSWDNAAGFLAAEELGAYVRMGNGDKYKPSYAGTGFWVIAPNADIWHKVIDIIKPEIDKL